MAVHSSLLTKAGAVGIVTSGGLTVTYFAWNHITLYSVEREVLEKDLKFSVTGPTTDSKTTVVAAPVHVSGSTDKNSTLSDKYEWSCEITVDTNDDATELASKLKDTLPTTEAKFKSWTKQQRDKARNLLLKACSKKRSDKPETPTNSKVKGLITLTKGSESSYSFKDHPELQSLLDSALHKVEREVIEKDMKLTVSTANKKITVTAPTSGSDPALTSTQSWTCEINVEQNDSTVEETLKTNLQNNLYKDSSLNDANKVNKELLVRACSPKTKPTGDAVTGELILIKKESNYNFKDHPELDDLTKTTNPGK